MKFETDCVRGKQLFEPLTGAVSVPIYQCATFRHAALGESTGFDYSRSENPTRRALEQTIALLEHAEDALAFATGMGAISAIVKLFNPGDHIIVSDDLYGGTYRLFNEYYARYGLSFSWIDTSDLAKIEGALRAETKALFIETPSNPMMKITDIKACADLIHARGGVLIADNTFLTPYFQNPLDLGADFVIHSGSKYLSGHNDALAGFIAHSSGEEARSALREAQKSEGASLAPFESWLVLRGIKTLAVRMEKHQENARAVAEVLRSHPKIERVFYTGFERSGLKQARGHNGMISFYVKDAADAPKILKRVKLILFAESLGGVESLITYPIVQTHGAIPESLRLSTGVTDRLLRLSVGIEAASDIITDLVQAIEG